MRNFHFILWIKFIPGIPTSYVPEAFMFISLNTRNIWFFYTVWTHTLLVAQLKQRKTIFEKEGENNVNRGISCIQWQKHISLLLSTCFPFSYTITHKLQINAFHHPFTITTEATERNVTIVTLWFKLEIHCKLEKNVFNKQKRNFLLN